LRLYRIDCRSAERGLVVVAAAVGCGIFPTSTRSATVLLAANSGNAEKVFSIQSISFLILQLQFLYLHPQGGYKKVEQLFVR